MFVNICPVDDNRFAYLKKQKIKKFINLLPDKCYLTIEWLEIEIEG